MSVNRPSFLPRSSCSTSAHSVSIGATAPKSGNDVSSKSEPEITPMPAIVNELAGPAPVPHQSGGMNDVMEPANQREGAQ